MKTKVEVAASQPFRVRKAWLCAVASSLIYGCAAHAPVPAPVPVSSISGPISVDAPVLYPGERMTWELSLRGIVGGQATVVVGEPGRMRGRQMIVVRSRTRSVGVVALIKEVRDEVTTWVDLDGGAPVLQNADLNFGGRESLIDIAFSPGQLAITFTRKGQRKMNLWQRLPNNQPGYDAHSILGVLRAWTVPDGARATFFALAGRRLWRNSVVMVKRERITTPLGSYPAVRIDGVAHRLSAGLKVDDKRAPRRYSIWISTDESRMPLRIRARTEYGDLTADLIDYDRPAPRFTARR